MRYAQYAHFLEVENLVLKSDIEKLKQELKDAKTATGRAEADAVQQQKQHAELIDCLKRHRNRANELKKRVEDSIRKQLANTRLTESEQATFFHALGVEALFTKYTSDIS